MTALSCPAAMSLAICCMSSPLGLAKVVCHLGPKPRLLFANLRANVHIMLLSFNAILCNPLPTYKPILLSGLSYLQPDVRVLFANLDMTSNVRL